MAVRPLHNVGRAAISTADLNHDGITIGLGDVMTLDNELVSHHGTHGSLLVAVAPTIQPPESGGANGLPPGGGEAMTPRCYAPREARWRVRVAGCTRTVVRCTCRSAASGARRAGPRGSE